MNMTWKSFLLIILVILSNVRPISSHESGAPCAAEHTLHPSSVYHGESRNLNTSPPPYRFEIADPDDSGAVTYRPGGIYTIRLMSLDSAHFRGFIIQPRVATRDGALIGNVRAGHFIYDKKEFSDYGMQYLECGQSKNDTITHTNKTIKFYLEAKWTVDKNYGPIQFVLTVVQERNEFWEMWQPESGLLTPERASGSAPENGSGLAPEKGLASASEKGSGSVPETGLGPTSEKGSEPTPEKRSKPTPENRSESTASTTPSTTESEDLLTSPLRQSPITSGEQSHWTVPVFSEDETTVITTVSSQPSESSPELENQPDLTTSSTPLQSSTESSAQSSSEEAESGSVEEEEPVEETKSTESPASSTSAQNNDGGGEETSEEKLSTEPPPATTSSSSSITTTITSNTNKPIRFPLASLARLKELFRQGQRKKVIETISTEKVTESTGTLEQARKENSSVTIQTSDELTSSPSTGPSAQQPTWPIVNRLVFPTLAPFPSESEGGKAGSRVNPGDGHQEKAGNGDGRSRVVFPFPAKPSDKVQPVFHLLSAAAVSEKENGEENGDEKANGDKAGVHNGGNVNSTSSEEDDSEGISKEESAEKESPVIRPPAGSEGILGRGEEVEGTLSPAASVLNEEENVNGSHLRLPGEFFLASAKKSGRRIAGDGSTSRRVGVNDTLEGEDPSNLKEEDFCASSPCYNGATCRSILEEERFECKCQHNWTGVQCDEYDFCGPTNPCKNGGRCVNDVSSYTCNCTDTYVGRNCESRCPPTLCKNGGACKLGDNGGYVCACRPGYTGLQCEIDIDDCSSKPCKNGATCLDRVNAYYCLCTEGYMGERCHRPCQDIYRSCQLWGEEGRCESTRKSTRWFDVNCGATCGQCVFDNDTVRTTSPLPPVLEPLHFLIGKWSVNTSHLHRFPIDFSQGNRGYYEELEFVPTTVPMFGTPVINFTATARNNDYSDDMSTSRGFLTLKPNTSPTKVALMNTGNDGITMLEEGVLSNDVTLEMKVEYIAIVPDVLDKAPILAKRQFTLYDGYLRETVERQLATGPTEYFTKYFYKEIEYQIY